MMQRYYYNFISSLLHCHLLLSSSSSNSVTKSHVCAFQIRYLHHHPHHKTITIASSTRRVRVSSINAIENNNNNSPSYPSSDESNANPSPPLNYGSSSSSSSNKNNTRRQKFASSLLSRFQGDFDNYRQVLSDRSSGLLPREGGGHEHFHCTLLPISPTLLPSIDRIPNNDNDTNDDDVTIPTTTTTIDGSTCYGAVLAAYYLDAMPQRLFRLRMYTFVPPGVSSGGSGDEEMEIEVKDDSTDDDAITTVKMKLYSLNPELEGRMRATSGTAIECWDQILREYLVTATTTTTTSNDNAKFVNGTFVELERCDILWSSVPDPVRHTYLFNNDTEDRVIASNGGGNLNSMAVAAGHHAIMMYDHEKGGVRLNSQMAPGTYIRVQDELSLWDNELWINDRGYDDVTKKRVYGNWRNDPYKMERLTGITTSVDDSNTKNTEWKRTIVDPSLSWTLGDNWRTEEEYNAKMTAMGGASSRVKPKE